ncbi:MAG: ABC transporter permease [Actinomycetota bacterium]|nr:ABC transporter permease [Actinomycetota bacterium]
MNNPWFDWQYISRNAEELLSAMRQHVALTFWAVLVGLAIAVPLALVARRHPRLQVVILGAAGVIYTIPSLALLAALVPFTGLTALTVEIALVGYTLLILIRNILTGLAGVPDDVLEAARGMGYGPARLLWQVELPLALPAILAGVRVATVSTIALVTVGALVGFGGLGGLILTGLNNNLYRAQILTASVLCVLLAIAADLLLVAASRRLTRWERTT